jgi:hypothetical protein
MSEPGPLDLGLQSLWRRPSLALAEMAWRWLYLAAAAGVLVFALIQVLKSVEVNPAEFMAAGGYQKALAGIVLAQALPLFVRAGVALAAASALLWLGVASMSRAAIFRALVCGNSASRKDRLAWPGILGIYGFRALLAFASVVAWTGVPLLCVTGIAVDWEGQNAAAALALCIILALLIWLAWEFVDWFLQVAPIFSVLDSRGPLTSIAGAVELFQSAAAACFAIWGWFAFCRIALFLAMSALALLAMASAGADLWTAVLAGALVLLAYSALSSWLYIARFAAYVQLAARAGSSPSPAIAEPTASI